MNNREFVSRVSNQLRMTSKDEYISDRLVLSTGQSFSKKLITQKIQRRSIDRDMSLYKNIDCIEFEPVKAAKCEFVEFRLCDKLSKSVKKFSDLIYTRYGSTIKELYSIDGKVSFTESTLYQLRLDSQRDSSYKPNKFYVLNDYIYIPDEIYTLSGLVLMIDQYELEQLSECSDCCDSVWDKEFIAPDGMLEDVIGYTVQQLSVTKQIIPDESSDMNENKKQ